MAEETHRRGHHDHPGGEDHGRAEAGRDGAAHRQPHVHADHAGAAESGGAPDAAPHVAGAAGHDRHLHPTEDLRGRFWVCLALTAPVLSLSEMVQRWLGFRLDFPGRAWVLLALSTVIFVHGGRPFLSGARDELGRRRPGMMTLIAMAITVAFVYSAATVFVISDHDFFWELATLIDVMLLGHWIESRSVLGASRALEELVRIMPAVAHVVRDGAVADVPSAEVRAGDLVLVRPGEKAPADGTVEEGESEVDESHLTGESRPVPKGPGQVVIGGSVNASGSLKVRIDKAGEDTYLAQVVRMVAAAQGGKSRTQDLANRAAALLFYVALAGGLATFAVWALLGRPDFALRRAVTVLVIACPHALGLAIPLVVALSTSLTARSGTLIRDRRVFEAVREVDAVVFDKTGTLTEGRLGVAEVIAAEGSGVGESDLLRWAAAVESHSEHAIGAAIVAEARRRGLDVPDVEGFKSFPGRGAAGKVAGREVRIGNPALFEGSEAAVAAGRLRDLAACGRTVVVAAVDGRPAGAFALADRVRPESAEAVRGLTERGIEVIMITGDAEDAAAAVAAELRIGRFIAGVPPDRKAREIERLRAAGRRVAMVGDGVNDAPALATADAGIAIGAGTGVAIESADIVLVRNDPRDVGRLVDFSRRTYAKMVQNLWWAAGYNIVALPLAAGVLARAGIVISPAIGALLMSASTVIVALNTQTLRRFGGRGHSHGAGRPTQ